MTSSDMVISVIPLCDERLDPKTKAIAGLAWEVAQGFNVSSIALVCGPGASDKAKEIAGYFTRVVTVESSPSEEEAITNAVLLALDRLAERGKIAAILLPQNLGSREVAAAIAGRRDLGIVTDVESLSVTDGLIQAELSKLEGAVISRICVHPDACMVFSVQTKAVSAAAHDSGLHEIENLALDLPPSRIGVLASVDQEQGEISLDTADIVVSGGKGLAGPEPFTGIMRELAGELGAALGATRAVVDAGWVPHSWQIGQTGKTVSPRLYVALAISGQIQHRVGMQTSGTIVAINKDAHIPMADIADLVVVGDVFQIVPALTRLLREEKVHT